MHCGSYDSTRKSGLPLIPSLDFSHDGGSDRLMMHLKDEEIGAVESKKLRARIIK